MGVMELRTTIKDVANRAGVSPSTVSLVLNKRPVPISQTTRDAVIRAAKELHYRPNQLAVGLVTKKTNTIGLIIPDNSNVFFACYSNKIEIAASRMGYNIIFGNTNNDTKKTLEYLQIFADRGVDGIILTQSEFSSAEETERCLTIVRELPIPVVLIDRVPTGSTEEYVILDHFEGGYIAFKHLLDMGHRRIGCITGSMTLSSVAERLDGCKKALAEAGIPYNPALTYEGDLQLQTGVEALPYLLGQNVTAIFAFNDMIAYGIYKELRNYKLKIPGDLSVVGFDDIFFSDIIQPPLTTVAQPLGEMAEAAVLRLLDIINGNTHPEDVSQIFRPVLKVRGSTRRIPQD